MKSINRFIYGPSPEEKVRDWQAKLRTQQRQLDREITNVSDVSQHHQECSGRAVREWSYGQMGADVVW